MQSEVIRALRTSYIGCLILFLEKTGAEFVTEIVLCRHFAAYFSKFVEKRAFFEKKHQNKCFKRAIRTDYLEEVLLGVKF